jgi:NTE family protein
VIIIGINPLLRAEVPKTAREIISRIDEISFNSSFFMELGAIAFVDELLKAGAPRNFVKLLFVHQICNEELGSLGASSKMNNAPDFLRHLHTIGRQSAEDWLDEHRDAVGKESTVDLTGLLPLQDGAFGDPMGIRQTAARTSG